MSFQVPGALWIAALVVVLVALIGLTLFFGGWRRFFRGKFANGFSRVIIGAILLAAVALVVAVAVNLRSYHRLTYERPVATLTFVQLGPQQFRSTLTQVNGRVTVTVLRGDEWELSARVLKWTGPGNLLGFNALYHLDRLEGRYQNLAQEQHDYHTAIDLSGGGGLDLWSFARAHAWLPWVDASYGSATYLPMADGAEYRVSMSQTGLVARPGNAIAQQAAAHWRCTP
jgi:hypothetical protein